MLEVSSLGHLLHAFVNGEYVGNVLSKPHLQCVLRRVFYLCVCLISQICNVCFYIGSGNGNNIEKSLIFKKPVSLRPGVNNISILGATVGFPVIISKLLIYSFIISLFFSSGGTIKVLINMFFLITLG